MKLRHSWRGTRATEDVSVRLQWKCASDVRRLARPRGLARAEARQCVRVATTLRARRSRNDANIRHCRLDTLVTLVVPVSRSI